MLSDEAKKLSSDSPSEELKERKSLKSSVIADNDPLKIKLKISKKTVDESFNYEKTLLEVKNSKPGSKNHQSVPDKIIFENGSDNEKINTEEKTKASIGEPKMKLRSKKEVEGELEQKEEESKGIIQEKKKTEFWNEKEFEKLKKRRKIPKCIIDDNLEHGESIRKRSKRNDDLEVKTIEELNEECKEIKAESFCWTCHKDGSIVKCDTCPRVFHLKCVSLSKDPSKNWICPECSLVLHAEKISTRSEAMKSLSLDQLCTLLNFAIGRMKNVPESQAFWKPVDPKEVPFYDKYITNPMDLNLLEKNMKAKMYGSPQAFLADAKWLLHNSIIFNSTQSPLTSTARFLVKICRQEMAEIENCPDCYLNAHTKDDWFVEVCRKPHILIWARLKGFPFWPAKAMSTNSKTQQVDARFFGAHDKAWVPVKECYLYSKNSPQLISKKRIDLDDAFLEVDRYIKKIRQKFGTFCYAPDKTPFMPELYDKQLQSMIPNFKPEKNLKKKRKAESIDLPVNENSKCGKALQNGKKKIESGTSQKAKSKQSAEEDVSKTVGDFCLINEEYMSEEKVVNDSHISPEDEIAQSLEKFDTHKKADGNTVDENSTDLEEDGSIHIPEHGYSRSPENFCKDDIAFTKKNEENISLEISEENKKNIAVENDNQIDQDNAETLKESNTYECSAESSDFTESNEINQNKEVDSQKNNSDQCEVSSTSAEIKVPETECSESDNCQKHLNSPNKTYNSKNQDIPLCSTESNKVSSEKTLTVEHDKKEVQTPKSFVNLSCDQQQKILTEAKLLAALDEMTAIGKQKVLNDLGLDASQIDIQQLAQENRQILEVLHKKCLSETKSYEEVAIKNEDFEQYLIEENSEENIVDDNLTPVCVKFDSLKVGDVNSFSNNKSEFSSDKSFEEPMLKIMDVQSLRDHKRISKNSKMKKKCENYSNLKKLKLKPVVELIKIDKGDKSVDNLNRKLNLSDQVSLLMVDGEKTTDVNLQTADQDAKLKLQNTVKPPRARKSMPSRNKTSLTDQNKTSPKNVNVISVDTENSAAQKNLLKTLKLEEKKIDELGRKTVLITTSDSGVKNIELKNTFNASAKKQVNEITIEAVKETPKCNESPRDGNSFSQKNVTVMTNPQVIVTNNGPAFVTNQNGQPNLALTQNNLGHLSFVQLSNVPSGIQTNLMTLSNETIGFNNSMGTLYNSGFNSEVPNSSSPGSVIITPTLTTGLPATISNSVNVAPKECLSKLNSEAVKFPINKIVTNKTTSGISVKSPASLGVITPQSNKLPPLIAITGEGICPIGEVGSVTAELNHHSFKMAEYMKATIEELLKELSNNGSLEAKYKLLTLEMEKLQWKHQQEIFELKQHSEKSLMELRSTMESDKQKCLGELKAQLESQHKRVISETKRKQWCANCGKEALFYCCWNTSYCDYPCQQLHWPGHMSTCAQLGNSVTIGTTSNSQHHGKNIGSKQQNCTYVPLIPRTGGNNVNVGGGIHTGKVFSNNRRIPSAQAHSSQEKRSTDSFSPQLPVNVTIRPQQYFS